jgi:HlyD family secretion protein
MKLMSNADHIGLPRSIQRDLLVGGLASLFLVAGTGG